MHTADPPRITSHPQELNRVVPGKPVTFTVRATGTNPLQYQWQQNRALEEGGNEEWQQCDAESFPNSNSPKLTISIVQKLSEGSYRCVVSNCAGTQTSEPAKLSVGKIPQLWYEVQNLRHYYDFYFYLQLILLASLNIHRS